MSKYTLLIVEDEPELLEIMRELLSPHADLVLLASNGQEAFELLQKDKSICAIVSDVSMPKMTGLQLLEKIRASYNAIPFIIVSAYGDKNTLKEAIRLQATDFLDKPFNSDNLIEVVSKALEYGAKLADVESELSSLHGDTNDEKTVELKRAKRTIAAMRIESSVYTKHKKTGWGFAVWEVNTEKVSLQKMSFPKKNRLK